jgi:hypothetical protein
MKIMAFLCLATALFAAKFPLKVSSEGRYLVDQDGIPFFIAGDTPWIITTNVSYSDAEYYLNAVQSLGVTAILCDLINHYGGANAPSNYYNDPPFNIPGDFDTANEDYFVFIDSVLNMAKSRNIVVFMTVCYMGYDCGYQGWASEMRSEGVAGCGRWGSWVGRRYKDFDNIVWVGGGDADQSACDLINEHNAMMDSLLFWDTDGLATAHSYRTRSAYDDYNESWLTINSTYVGDNIASECNTTYNQSDLPAILIEGSYEGESASIGITLEQFFTPVLYARHMGSFFGNYPRYGFYSGWQSTLNSNGTMALSYFSKLFRSRPWWKLIPDRSHTVITANYTEDVAIASDSSSMVAYSYDNRTFTVDMTEISGSQAKAWWYNPQTGSNTFIGTYNTSGTQNFTTGGINVLVIDDGSINFPEPGKGIYSETTVQNAPGVSNIQNQTVMEGGSFTDINLDDYVSDPDNADSEIIWTTSTTINITVTITDRVAAITVNNAEWNGNETVTFTATDPGGLSDSDGATFTVTTVNDTPVVSDIPNQEIAEGGSFNTINLNDYVNDVDNTDAQMKWSYSGNTQLTVSIVNRIATITTPNTDWNGSETITFRAIDPGGLFSSDAATFTVNAVNDAPVAMNDEISTSEGSSITIYVLNNDIDIDGVLVPSSVTIVLNPTHGGAGINPTTGAITYTPIADFQGADTLTYTVRDNSSSLSNAAMVTITISSVNGPPQISTLSELTFNEDDSLVYSFSDLYKYVSDPDTPDSLLALFFNSGINVNASMDSNKVIFKAVENWYGRDTLLVIVSDSEWADTADIYINIHPINDQPVLSSLPDTLNFINTTNVVLMMKGYVQDEDLPNDSLRWDFSVSNEKIEYQYNVVTTALTLSTSNFKGVGLLTINVTDDSGAVASDLIVIQVTSDPTGISDITTQIPKQYEIYQNYPNPFNPATRIKFGLPFTEHVKVAIYNILGQQVKTILDDFKSEGYYILEFDAGSLPSGIYFYRIQTEKFSQIKKMVLIR